MEIIGQHTQINQQINIFSIGQNVANKIGEFVDQNSRDQLSATCKYFRKIFKENSYFVILSCFQKYFSTEIEYFIDCGDDEEYIKDKNEKDNKVIRRSQYTQQYKNILENSSIIANNWIKIWGKQQEYFNDIDFKGFYKKMIQIFRDPPLPILKLRRENIGLHCQTWMQNDLAEVLYESGQSIGLMNCFDEDNIVKEAMNYLNENKRKFIDEMIQFSEKSKNNKQLILELRWYIIKSQKLLHFDDGKSQKQNMFKQQQQKQYNGSIQEGNTFYQQKKECEEEVSSDEDLPSLELNLSKQKSNIIEQNQHILLTNKVDGFKQRGNTNNFYQKLQNPQLIKECSRESKQSMEFEGIQNQREESKEQGNNQSIDFNFSSDFLCQLPLILQIYLNLYFMILNQVKVVSQYLQEHQNSHTNAFDLISEYNLKWSTYVAALHELKDNIEDFYQLFNEGYETIFPEYPSYPKISLWRKMGKMWNEHVYENKNLKLEMFDCFIKILTKRRKENLSFQIKHSGIEEKLQNAYYMPNQFEQISLMMTTSFIKSKKFSFKHETISTEYEFDHNYFTKNPYQVDLMLTNFVDSMMDISINEIYVHYLGHTQVQVEQPYLDLEEMVLKNCREFYNYEYQHIFSAEKLSVYYQFLDGDIKYLSKIFKERTLHRIRLIQLEHWIQMYNLKLEGLIIEQVSLIKSQTLMLEEKISTDSLSPVREQQQEENDQKNGKLNKEDSEKNTPTELKKKSSSDYSKKLQDAIQEMKQSLIPLYFDCIQKNIISPQDNYEYCLQQLAQEICQNVEFDEDRQQFKEISTEIYRLNNTKCDQDQEIDDLNAWRKIPSKLNEMETKFYSLNGSVSLQELHQLVDEKRTTDQQLQESDSECNKEYSEYHSSQEDFKSSQRKRTFSKQLENGKQIGHLEPLSDEMSNDDDEDDDLPEALGLQKTTSCQLPILTNSINQSDKIKKPPQNQFDAKSHTPKSNLKISQQLLQKGDHQQNINEIEEFKTENINEISEDSDLEDLQEISLSKQISTVVKGQQQMPVSDIYENSNNYQTKNWGMTNNLITGNFTSQQFNSLHNSISISKDQERLQQGLQISIENTSNNEKEQIETISLDTPPKLAQQKQSLNNEVDNQFKNQRVQMFPITNNEIPQNSKKINNNNLQDNGIYDGDDSSELDELENLQQPLSLSKQPSIKFNMASLPPQQIIKQQEKKKNLDQMKAYWQQNKQNNIHDSQTTNDSSDIIQIYSKTICYNQNGQQMLSNKEQFINRSKDCKLLQGDLCLNNENQILSVKNQGCSNQKKPCKQQGNIEEFN